VKPHAYGLETSFVTEYGEGGRLVNFNVEYDALPGIGHACGHNLIATGSIAAFLGLVAAMKKHPVPGRVRLLGTPAEEGGGGKIKLIDAGAYEGVDASLMTHPVAGTSFGTIGNATGISYGTCVASTKFRATFTGKPAHAAAAPHEGINALDAAVLSYNGTSMLRQQIRPEQRIQGVILEGGAKENVITPSSLLAYNVRAANLKDTRELQHRVVKCFEGAAIATGCKVEFQEFVSSTRVLINIVTSYRTNRYANLIPNRSLCSAYAEVMKGLSCPVICDLERDPAPGSYSTDMGTFSTNFTSHTQLTISRQCLTRRPRFPRAVHHSSSRQPIEPYTGVHSRCRIRGVPSSDPYD
jgi:amidohydrolase